MIFRRASVLNLVVSLVAVGLMIAGCGGNSESTTSGTSPAGDSRGAGPDEAPTTTAQPSRTATVRAGIVGTTKLNLNSAGGTEFSAAIPNFPSNMVREFPEYRPYVSIQQFRREIGKYVSASQVAEWEKYVYVPVDVNNADAETLKQLPGVTDAVATQLIAARPFASNDSFLLALGAQVSQANALAAPSYLK